jgi:hypothetical protein
MNRLRFTILLMLVAGCRLDNQNKNKCVTTDDCNVGFECVASVCVSLTAIGDGGISQCRETFPPATCQHPDLTYSAPMSPSALAAVLPGRWLFCTSDSSFGGIKFGPADSVGLEFESDGSWHFVFADASGVAVIRPEPSAGGPSYEVHSTTVNGDDTQVDVDLHLADGSTYRLWTQVADGSQRLRMANLFGGVNYYVWSPPPDGCTAPDAGSGCGSTHDMSEPDLSWPPDLSSWPRDLSSWTPANRSPPGELSC